MLFVFYIFLLCLVPCIFKSSEINKTEDLTSCSDQLWFNETEDACQIRRLGFNSFECQYQLTEIPANIHQRGIIKIEPYKDDTRTAFKITAYNITWNNFLIRFQQQNSKYCMKREFTIKKSVQGDKILVYKKPWASAVIEDNLIDFEYAYGVNNKYDGKRTFLIHVPKSDALDNYNALSLSLQNVTLFIYVETTNLYQLICKIHTAPKHLNVTSYQIEVYFKKNNNFEKIDGPYKTSAEKAVYGVIDYKYYTYGVPGEYVFYVQPLSEETLSQSTVQPKNCSECRISLSPVVIIPKSSPIFTIGLIGVSCLIPICLITFYMYFRLDRIGPISRVLLITTPANNAHKKIGRSLANILIQKFNIPTMIDILDIPIPKIMPSDWFTKSFECATHVVILLSDDKPVTSIYRNIDNLLYTLVHENPDKKCCTIEFPFSISKRGNLKFNVHRHFKLMEDYNAFINFIHNRGLLYRLIKKMTRNDLYHDLVRQIDDYKNDTIYKCSNDNTESMPLSCDDENEINRTINSKDKTVEINIDNPVSWESDTISNNSDDSDMGSVNHDILIILEELHRKEDRYCDDTTS